jgi:hypothetical protein
VSEQPKKRPVKELRIGAVKAAIWANETERGPRYGATFERLFKDGETWKSSSSFGRDELLVLAKLADQVHTWMTEAEMSEERSGR